MLNNRDKSVCSPTVRIIAFQAIDPGSTPGRRIFFLLGPVHMALEKKEISPRSPIFLSKFKGPHYTEYIN